MSTQRKPPSIQGSAYAALLSAAERARSAAADTIEPHGITRQQYNVLRILRGAGPEGLPTLTIAERMVERAPGTTRMIDRLERKGWVKRERRSRDRRCVHCRITPEGLELLKTLDRPVQDANKTIFAELADHDTARLIRLLERVLPRRK